MIDSLGDPGPVTVPHLARCRVDDHGGGDDLGSQRRSLEELEPLLLISRARTDFHDPDKDRHLGAVYFSGVFQAGFTDLPDFVDAETEGLVGVRLAIDHAKDGECISIRLGENDVADGGEFLNFGNARKLEALFGDELLRQIDAKCFGWNFRCAEIGWCRIGRCHVKSQVGIQRFEKRATLWLLGPCGWRVRLSFQTNNSSCNFTISRRDAPELCI